MTLRLGDLHSYNCPGAGQALRKALGGATPLFDSVRIEPGSNAVLVENEYVAVGKTVRHLGNEVSSRRCSPTPLRRNRPSVSQKRHPSSTRRCRMHLPQKPLMG